MVAGWFSPYTGATDFVFFSLYEKTKERSTIDILAPEKWADLGFDFGHKFFIREPSPRDHRAGRDASLDTE